MKIFNMKPILYFLLSLNIAVLYGQKPEPEFLHTSFDKPFYVAGEDIWYSVFFFNQKNIDSKILYVDLIGPGGESVYNQNLIISNRAASGDIPLPPNLPEGYYLFRAYTRWNLGFNPQEVFTHEIPIYSTTLQEGKEASPQPGAKEVDNNPYTPKNATGLQISTDKNTLGLRQACQVTFTLDQVEGKSIQGANVALSVLALPYAMQDKENIAQTKAHILDSRNYTIDSSQGVEGPEQGISHQYMLKHPITLEPVNSNFIAGYVQESQQKFYGVAKEGRVDATLNNFLDQSIVQIFDANPFTNPYIPLVSILPPKHSLPHALPSQQALPYSNIQIRYINEYKKQFQLNKVYGTLGRMRNESNFVKSPFPTPTISYNVDDYIEFEYMESFIEEVIPLIKIAEYDVLLTKEELALLDKIRNKGYTIKKKGNKPVRPAGLTGPGSESTNENNRYMKLNLASEYKDMKNQKYLHEIKRPPILLVNNYFTYDVDAVLSIDWANIERIDLFYVKEDLFSQFGYNGMSGVIAFYTRDGKTPEAIKNTSNSFTIQGIYPRRSFTRPPLNDKSKIPDFTPLLAWNPNVFLSNTNTNTLSFFSNDRIGKFLIKAQGITSDGTPIYAEKIIEVKRSF